MLTDHTAFAFSAEVPLFPHHLQNTDLMLVNLLLFYSLTTWQCVEPFSLCLSHYFYFLKWQSWERLIFWSEKHVLDVWVRIFVLLKIKCWFNVAGWSYKDALVELCTMLDTICSVRMIGSLRMPLPLDDEHTIFELCWGCSCWVEWICMGNAWNYGYESCGRIL